MSVCFRGRYVSISCFVDGIHNILFEILAISKPYKYIYLSTSRAVLEKRERKLPDIIIIYCENTPVWGFDEKHSAREGGGGYVCFVVIWGVEGWKVQFLGWYAACCCFRWHQDSIRFE